MSTRILKGMRLYLIRHAESESGEPDELRKLTPGGEEQSRRLGSACR
jgi:phosphohistidine phosphatase SixA